MTLSKIQLKILQELDNNGSVSYTGLIPEELTVRGLNWKGYVRLVSSRYETETFAITRRGKEALQRHHARQQYPRPALGQKVAVVQNCFKNHDGFKTVWLRNDKKEVVYGIFIGYRTVYDGKWETGTTYEDYSDAPYFSQTTQHEVWMIVTNPRQNPIYAFPEDIKIINE